MRKTKPRTEEAETIGELAARLGTTPLCVKVMGAAGCPGLEQFAPTAKNAAELSRLLGVSRSTVGDWILAGAPQEPDKTFSIPKVVAWRNTRNASAKPAEPRDDLLRGFCRVLRVEAALATMAAAEELAESAKPATDITIVLARHFAPICPSESEVEKLLLGPTAR